MKIGVPKEIKNLEFRVGMKAAGADVVFNYYAEAGAGFAEHALSNVLDILPQKPAEVAAN